MTEYIEREVVLNAITADGFEHFSGCLSSSEVRLIELMRDSVSEIPAADVAPVVRCRDCVHWLNEDGLDDHVCLKIYSDGAVSPYAWQFREPNDFCSYGECKEVEHG